MRSVSYVQRVSLDYTGTIFPHAICLGDADNDSLNELVVGDTSGKLYIYKNYDLGDVCNKGRNFVVAVGAEGWFHLFDISAAAAKSDSSSQQDGSIGNEQKPSYTQHIPANTKVMLISDIGEDAAAAKSDSSSQQDGSIGNEQKPSYTQHIPANTKVMRSLVHWKQTGFWNNSACVCPSRDVVLHLTTGRIHNKNVSTHLIGSICRGSKDDSSKGGLFALCTLDGTLKLMDSSEKLLWSVQVDHQLFALQKLDVTCDGREEVVACAWDGQTYIIDHARMVVRFQFDENVNAFCAGQYACKDGRNSPCLVYVSFNHKIYVYWRVELERMEPTNLLSVLEERPEYPDLLHRLGVDISDTVAVRKLIGDVNQFYMIKILKGAQR
uniref:Integrin alpha FG-GAP repeat containing 2 n=1 Tax=Sinocyclocheilus anshuiensis TaxID=1608454 RepID=A0A671M8M6_9TELE